MIALIRAEALKLSSTRTALGLFIAAVLVSVVPAAVFMGVAPKDFISDNASVAAMGLNIVPILAVVFGVLGMTNEYRHGTITYTYLGTPRRWVVIVVKLICYGVVGAAVMVLAGALVVLTIEIGAVVRGVSLSWLHASAVTDGDTLLHLVLLIVTVGLMTAFGVALGALFRAQVPTVAGVVVWALAIENIIVALKPRIGIYLPFTVFQQLDVGSSETGSDVISTLSRPEAFVIGLAYIALASLLAVFISMRRDVT